MATATRKTPTAKAAVRTARVSDPASLEFRTYQDNGGNYRWEIVDGDGASLVHSESFSSQEQAESAAREVHQEVSSARFEPSAPGERVTAPV